MLVKDLQSEVNLQRFTFSVCVLKQFSLQQIFLVMNLDKNFPLYNNIIKKIYFVYHALYLSLQNFYLRFDV